MDQRLLDLGQILDADHDITMKYIRGFHGRTGKYYIDLYAGQELIYSCMGDNEYEMLEDFFYDLMRLGVKKMIDEM